MKFRIRIPTILFAALFLVASVQAGLPDLFQTFEDAAEPGYVADPQQGEVRVKFPEGSQISFEEARFGKGSLLINSSGDRKNTLAWEALLSSAELEAFQSETRSLTLVAWVRSPDWKPFVLFWRVPSDIGLPGFFQFAFLGGEKSKLFFSVTGPEEAGKGVRHEVLSPKTVSIVPEDWNHFAVTFDEGVVQFYCNGEPVGEPCSLPIEEIPPLAAKFPSMKAFLGVDAGSSVDDFGLFGDRALSGEDIRAIHDTGLQAFLENSASQKSKSANPNPKKP